MRLLTAIDVPGPGEFCDCVVGEIVILGMVCAKDDPESGGDGSCGCGVVFTGIASHRTSTAAMVSELDISHDDLEAVITASLRTAGWEDAAGLAEDFADECIELGELFEPGLPLRRIRLTDEVALR